MLTDHPDTLSPRELYAFAYSLSNTESYIRAPKGSGALFLDKLAESPLELQLVTMKLAAAFVLMWEGPLPTLKAWVSALEDGSLEFAESPELAVELMGGELGLMASSLISLRSNLAL